MRPALVCHKPEPHGAQGDNNMLILTRRERHW